MRYSTRNDAFSRARTWVLEPSSLRIEEEKTVVREILLSDIIACHLEFVPTRPEPNRFRCRIRLRDATALEFFNRTYQGVYDFANTSGEYVTFVRALHDALSRQSPGCVFASGVSAARHALNTACLTLTVVVLGVVSLALLLTGLVWIVLVKIILLLIYLPAAFRWLRINKPTNYAADSIPPELLPSASTAKSP